MSDESVDTISGSAASALWATAPAATASDAPLKNCRRESMLSPWLLLRGIAEQRAVEPRFGDPKIAQTPNVAIDAGGLFACIR